MLAELKNRPLENMRALPDLYKRAAAEGISVTQLLEDADPSHEWEQADREIGAFGRVIQASGARFKSNPSERLWADTFGSLYDDDETRAIIPEWAASVWTRARSGGYAVQAKPQGRIMGSDEFALGSVFRPYLEQAGIYGQEITPGLSLDDLIGFQSSINSDSIRRAIMVDADPTQVRLSRITEKSDIPRSTITLSSESLRLYKYGRGIEMSYESIRRVPVDRVGLWIAQAAVQVEADRVAQALDVALNGDGVAGSSADNYNQSTLDTGTTPTVKGFLAFKNKWPSPFALNLIVARQADLVALQMLQMPNNTPYFTQVQGELGFGGLLPLQQLNGQTVYFAQSDAVPSGVYLGLDTRWALERVTEAGSNIRETMDFVERQTSALFFTENDGIGVMDARANKTWTMA